MGVRLARGVVRAGEDRSFARPYQKSAMAIPTIGATPARRATGTSYGDRGSAVTKKMRSSRAPFARVLWFVSMLACTTSSSTESPASTEPSPPASTGPSRPSGEPLAPSRPGAPPKTAIASIAIERPLAVSLPADRTGVLRVRIARNGYVGALSVMVEGLPADVSADAVTLGSGETEALIPFSSSVSLLDTSGTVHVSTSTGLTDEAPVHVSVGDQERRFGNLDVALGGRGYVPFAGTRWPGSFVATRGGRAYLLSPRCDLERFELSTLTRDRTFGSDGSLHLDALGISCDGLVRAPNGTLVATALAGAKKKLFRLSEDGVVDRGYEVDLDASESPSFDPNGRVLVVSSEGVLRRYETSGLADATFAPTEVPSQARLVCFASYTLALVPGAKSGMTLLRIGASGGRENADDIARTILDGPAEPESAKWALALPSGDALVAVETPAAADGNPRGALVRLVAPAEPTGAWDARRIAMGTSFGEPVFTHDGTFYVTSYTWESGGPGSGRVHAVDATYHVIASGRLGSDVEYPWFARGALALVGDGTAVFTALDPRKPAQPVIARLFVAP
jgi:hypothetical protein